MHALHPWYRTLESLQEEPVLKVQYACRSTYDFRPPFKVYTTIEEDRDAANKVTDHVMFVSEPCLLFWFWHE